MFADLFLSGRGRPSIPGDVIASVLLLQTLEDKSDSEAMIALRCDLRWKVACGLPIDHEGYHDTVLTVWRNRLRRSDRPHRIFEAVREVIDWDAPGKPRIAWDDKTTRDALVSALVNDANTIVDALAGTELDRQASQALALLALIAGQGVEPAEGSDGTDGRWRIAQTRRRRPGHLRGRPGGQACAQDRAPASGWFQRPCGHRAGHRAVHRGRVDRSQR